MKSYVTNDFSFASYLVMNDIKLIFAKKMGKTYKFDFMVDEKDVDKIDKLKYTFPTSESSKFDDAVKKLKRILFSEGGQNEN